MGSKQALLPFIFEHLHPLKFDTVLDAFSGSGCVSYEFKRLGKKVTTNDYLHFSQTISKALIENNSFKVNDDMRELIMRERNDADTKVEDNFSGIYFSKSECVFLDSLWKNISEIENEYQRSVAMGAACRACQKRYPRGIFTVTEGKGKDGRRDFRTNLKQHFKNALNLYNEAVFDNGRLNKALCKDAMEIEERGFDLVYLDPPYWSPLSDNDYVRRYHFIEGYSIYWNGLSINGKTKTRKFDSYSSPFSKLENAKKALRTLFERFSDSIIVVSYSSNSSPNRDDLFEMLSQVKDDVEVFEIDHTYSFGNQGFRKGDIKNRVQEYLFVAS